MNQDSLNLFVVLLGSNPPGRVVEQHDYFFGIGPSLRDLVPAMRAFWPEAGNSLHIDGWRQVTHVDGYKIRIVERSSDVREISHKLFFVNLGGYTEQKLEEQHYTLLTVQPTKADALQRSKATGFFKQNAIKNIQAAGAHIDEKYGIDVDDFYRVEDLLSPELKQQYSIELIPASEDYMDPVHLGYLRLDKL